MSFSVHTKENRVRGAKNSKPVTSTFGDMASAQETQEVTQTAAAPVTAEVTETPTGYVSEIKKKDEELMAKLRETLGKKGKHTEPPEFTGTITLVPTCLDNSGTVSASPAEYTTTKKPAAVKKEPVDIPKFMEQFTQLVAQTKAAGKKPKNKSRREEEVTDAEETADDEYRHVENLGVKGERGDADIIRESSRGNFRFSSSEQEEGPSMRL